MAEEKAISLEVQAWGPCPVSGDPVRLRRLFFNLLDNAIKHTPGGGRVRVRCLEAHGESVIEMSDTGVGIEAEHLPQVFRWFYRVDAARTANQRKGLGLAICRAIVEAHNGRIEIDSIVGRGTTIRVVLPGRAGEDRSPGSPPR